MSEENTTQAPVKMGLFVQLGATNHNGDIVQRITWEQAYPTVSRQTKTQWPLYYELRDRMEREAQSLYDEGVVSGKVDAPVEKKASDEKARR